jgi:hypothetical protein
MRAGIIRRHPQSRAHVEQREAQRETGDELEVVEKMIERVREGLSDADVIPSIADLLRLLEFRREHTRSQAEPVTVGWVDQCRQDSVE